jgi:hypothetical protein
MKSYATAVGLTPNSAPEFMSSRTDGITPLCARKVLRESGQQVQDQAIPKKAEAKSAVLIDQGKTATDPL